MIFHGNILQKYSKRLRMVNLMCILCLKPGNATVNGKGVVKSTVDWNSDALTKKWQRGSCMVWFVYVFFF